MMPTLARHYALLELAHRALVHMWHPDSFAGNLRLQLKPQEKLQTVSLALEAVVAAIEAGECPIKEA